MKSTLLTTIVAISVSQGVTILSEADFDATNDLNGGGGGATMTVTSDPAGGTNQVGAIDSGGTGVWGAVSNVGNAGTLTLPAGVVAGTDTWVATFDLYIPTATTFTETDRVNLIVRRNNTNGNGNNVADNNVWNSLAADAWHTISLNGTIEAFETDGTTAVTGYTPILSFYDRTDGDGANTEAGTGISAYIDNWSFTVTESAIPEPSTSVAALLGLALLGARRKR
ncbi:PEP-CTERM sorting domain-containing protein [Akkermansiaceae bacterium]|nr:PEP-CTERM sorting domain-containing protein [Akkermansiaceae bacterium]